MTFPNLQADPAELIFAEASHVDAAVVLLDSFFAHRAFLRDEFVDPLVVLVHDHIVPIAYVNALQRPMTSQSTMSADFRLAFAYHGGFDDSIQVDSLSA